MADTIVNTPSGSGDNGASGVVVALVLVALVVVGGFVWYRYYGGGKPASDGTTNINVTVPAPTTDTKTN